MLFRSDAVELSVEPTALIQWLELDASVKTALQAYDSGSSATRGTAVAKARMGKFFFISVLLVRMSAAQ